MGVGGVTDLMEVQGSGEMIEDRSPFFFHLAAYSHDELHFYHIKLSTRGKNDSSMS